MCKEKSDTKVCRHYYCKDYGELAGRLCPSHPNNNDDWDELEDPCENCHAWGYVEVEMNVFQVKCKKDKYKAKAGDIVDAYVNNPYLIVGGYLTSMDEFNEYFEIV